MSKPFTSKARHSHTPRSTARHFLGWALERAAALDRQGARGLLADIAIASVLKRQTAFAILATHQPSEIGCFLDRIGEGHLGDAFRARTARELLRAAFGRQHVPMGYLRALERIGADPLREPEHYRRLLEIYTDTAERQKAHALRYCGYLSGTKIAVVDILDPVLLDPQIVAGLHNAEEAHNLNNLLKLIRRICSSATDEDVAVSFRGHGTRWHQVAKRWLARADRLPEAPFRSPAGLSPISSAQEMVEIGQRMRNCLGTKVGEVLLGLSYYYRADVEREGAFTLAIVEITPLSNGSWIVAGVHGPHHRSLEPSAVHRLLRPLLDQGVLVSATRPDTDKLATMLGVHRFDGFRLPTIDAPEEEEFGTLFAGNDWALA